MDGLGREIASMIGWGLSLLIIFVPLGLWKLIEIIVWLFNHVRIEL